VDGLVYNASGYEICGKTNLHGKRCQRIGSCPFHPKSQITLPVHKRTVEEIMRILKKRQPYKQGWTKDEHISFLKGLQLFKKGSWKDIAEYIGTKTAAQTQTHAHRYFQRQKQEIKNKRSIHDISLNNLNEYEMSDSDSEPLAATISPPIEKIIRFPKKAAKSFKKSHFPVETKKHIKNESLNFGSSSCRFEYHPLNLSSSPPLLITHELNSNLNKMDSSNYNHYYPIPLHNASNYVNDGSAFSLHRMQQNAGLNFQPQVFEVDNLLLPSQPSLSMLNGNSAYNDINKEINYNGFFVENNILNLK